MDTLAALYRIKDEVENGVVPDLGICRLVSCYSDEDIYIEHMMDGWDYSKSPIFPIEGNEESFVLPGKWKGKRGRLRYDLLLYLIRTIEEGDYDFYWDDETQITERENNHEMLFDHTPDFNSDDSSRSKRS